MIYLVGGAPRTGKSILAQRVASKVRAGWTSTDLLLAVLRAKNAEGIKTRWDASEEAVRASADWFFPCLERFVWGANSMADDYVIEGVDFLPEHVDRLAQQYPVRSAFLGCSAMTLLHFDQFPGRSSGYRLLPEPLRREMAQDVPRWSEFIGQQCEQFGLPYFDTSRDFSQRLDEAEAALLASV